MNTINTSQITGGIGGSRPQSLGLPETSDTKVFEAALNKAEALLVTPEKEAGQAIEHFAQGENGSLHETLISVEKADISFKFMMSVRNKMVDAYREVMRMGA